MPQRHVGEMQCECDNKHFECDLHIPTGRSIGINPYVVDTEVLGLGEDHDSCRQRGL